MAMVTDIVIIMTIRMRVRMIDIHSHLMYDVDDGSKNLLMTKKMLELYKKEGINSVFLTPHVNSPVSRSTREDHYEKYKIIRKLALDYNIDVFLGAEIYISFRLPQIDFSKYTMGNSKFLLLEFSTQFDTPIYEHCYNLIKRGYKIIIAHVERYPYLSLEEIMELKNIGVLFQINSSSILKSFNSKTKKHVKKLLKENLIDFVASDSHNLTNRTPNLLSAKKVIEKFLNKEISEDLFLNNQLKLLFTN